MPEEDEVPSGIRDAINRPHDSYIDPQNATEAEISEADAFLETLIPGFSSLTEELLEEGKKACGETEYLPPVTYRQNLARKHHDEEHRRHLSRMKVLNYNYLRSKSNLAKMEDLSAALNKQKKDAKTRQTYAEEAREKATTYVDAYLRDASMKSVKLQTVEAMAAQERELLSEKAEVDSLAKRVHLRSQEAELSRQAAVHEAAVLKEVNTALERKVAHVTSELLLCEEKLKPVFRDVQHTFNFKSATEVMERFRQLESAEMYSVTETLKAQEERDKVSKKLMTFEDDKEKEIRNCLVEANKSISKLENEGVSARAEIDDLKNALVSFEGLQSDYLSLQFALIDLFNVWVDKVSSLGSPLIILSL